MSYQTRLLPTPDQPLLPQPRATARPDTTLAWLPPALLEPVYALPSSPVLTALMQAAATRARTLTTTRLPQTTGPAGRQPATAPPAQTRYAFD